MIRSQRGGLENRSAAVDDQIMIDFEHAVDAMFGSAVSHMTGEHAARLAALVAEWEEIKATLAQQMSADGPDGSMLDAEGAFLAAVRQLVEVSQRGEP
ncbi:hypothetical protein EB73_06660 [Mycobacterium sp. SWH-M3]|nr:hypothetical protein EB73_06660 [Mycobacterium sp. SWH-M3]